MRKRARRSKFELVNLLLLALPNKQRDGSTAENDLGQEHLQIQAINFWFAAGWLSVSTDARAPERRS